MRAVKILKSELTRVQDEKRSLLGQKADLDATLIRVSKLISDLNSEITNIQDGITKLQT